MATYEVIMPSDYLHILNCICIYKLQKTYKCYNIGDTWRSPATRLTADMYSLVLDNFWNKPSYKKPYYYIHNVNTNNDTLGNSSINPSAGGDDNPTVGTDPTGNNSLGNAASSNTTINYASVPTNTDTDGTIITKTNNGTSDGGKDLGKDGMDNNIANSIGPSKTISLSKNNIVSDYSNVERGAAIRYGNVSLVRLEIRYGTDNSIFKLTDVYVDYIKAPQNIRLTQLEIDKTEDISQMLEYPDYVCQEIINELVHLVMENISDLRLQTHPVVSLSIANPAQALAPEAAGQSA